MSVPLQELAGLEVIVDQVLYRSDAPTPPDRPHCFAYHISIHNRSDTTVTIKGRKWIVRNARGEVTALEGDGVVGQFPELQPGEKFSYHSHHVLDTLTATADGSYIGVTADGRRVFTRIPRFEMRVPE